MAQARGNDSHAGGGMLDYNIRAPSPFPYHLGFMVGLAEEGPLAHPTMICGVHKCKS
jgi:hypothetical protein